MSKWMSKTARRLSSLTQRLAQGLVTKAFAERRGSFVDDIPLRVEPAPGPNPAEAMLETFSEGRADIVGILADVTTMTESRIVQVGECVAAIVQETQGYVQEVGQTLSAFDSSGDSSGVARAVKEQGATITEYLDGLAEDCRRQEETTRAAIEVCARISKAAAHVNRLTGASKLLSLNTSIHANRLGGNGQALGVIAQEMQATSERVRDINERISGTAEDLVSRIEATVTQSDQLRELARGLSEEIDELSREIREGSASVEGRVREATAVSEAKLGELLQQSMDALSHLQFQDPMIQNLQQLDPLMANSLTEVASAVGQPKTYEPLRFQSNLGLHLDMDSAPVASTDTLDDMLFFD